ncbi:MAG: RNA polymerase sigma factor [Clostridia bacterium]|nr:RNA polymerase sigma factor [Clostridia bacterium]
MENGASSYRRFLSGDDEAFVEIIRLYKDGLMMYLNGYVNDIYIAEELVEETFFRIVTKKPKFSGKSSFKTWLYAIGRNVALDSLRQRRWVSDSPVDDGGQKRRDEHEIEREYFEQEQKIILHNALRALPPEYRRVLYLKYFENFSNGEISLILKKGEHQVENLIHRAKKSLKSELDRAEFEYEEL